MASLAKENPLASPEFAVESASKPEGPKGKKKALARKKRPREVKGKKELKK